MKITGIIRRIDDLGRVDVPKEIRKTLGIKEGDPLEMHVEDGAIVLRLHRPELGYINRLRAILDGLDHDKARTAIALLEQAIAELEGGA